VSDAYNNPPYGIIKSVTPAKEEKLDAD
jgi:hypothetical protein